MFTRPDTSGDFSMDQDWLVYHLNPRKPQFVPPPGAVDAHCHVFGPGEKFPYARERKYTPCDAPRERLWQLRRHLGLSRNVIVQATCHGADNRALVDALIDGGDSVRGVATVREDVSDQELEHLHAAGVRGVRFNFVKRLVDNRPIGALRSIAPRIKPMGWHVVMYFEASDIEELSSIIAALPVPVVIDHMARPDVTRPLNDPAFASFVALMRDNSHVWTKVSCPERLTRLDTNRIAEQGYTDVVPFARHLVDTFPDRVLWGTDWPHPNMKSHMPDDGQLLDQIPHIAVNVELQKKLLVDNPHRLYWS